MFGNNKHQGENKRILESQIQVEEKQDQGKTLKCSFEYKQTL